MKYSVRKFLLVNLLLAMIMTTTMTAIGNYFLDQKDIQEHLDTMMAISTLIFEALLNENLQHTRLAETQENLDQIPDRLNYYYQDPHLNELLPPSLYKKFNFQVWNDKNELLLHSAGNTGINIINSEEGFKDININHKKWRIFTTKNDELKIRTILAEAYDTRNELGFSIAKDDLYIMLLTFPLSGLLIWIIIGHGLASLDRVAAEVADRAHNNLDPVSLEEIPEEIKPVIDELNSLFYRLQEGFEREKRFAADAAHELRTPLAALKAQAQVALNINDIDEKNRALEKLIASVNRSTHIVQQLLTMSKLVPESMSIKHTDKINLIKIAREILAMMVPLAVEKDIELEFQHKPHIPNFHGNATAIGILIRNLVDNAIRYCKEGARISVSVVTDGSHVILIIADNGPGVPDALKERIFERFYRALGNKAPGSGLGLSIVRQICDLHHAKIVLEDQPVGTGLIIKIFFPLQQTHPKIT